MSGAWKAVMVISAILAAVMMAPLLVLAGMLPSQTSRGLFAACAEVRGARAGVVPDPPTSVLTAEEVLLRIARTATTLGFGRQGEVVAAAISLQRTGLTNAANAAVPETQRYAHSTEISSGAGALGLPASWGSAAALMTPELSTALVMDRMVESIPAWRDADPAALIAELLGGTAEDYASAVAAANARLAHLPQTPTTPAVKLVGAAPAAEYPTARAATAVIDSTTPPPPLTHDEARTAAAENPDAAACLEALTMAVPPPAPSANPVGPALAESAQHAVGTQLEQENPVAAQFVSDLCRKNGVRIPDSIPGQIATGWTVSDPAPGDLVFIDISADQGPHLVGIAVDEDTMVTVLPGHVTPEWTRIGPNRIVRRITVDAA